MENNLKLEVRTKLAEVNEKRFQALNCGGRNVIPKYKKIAHPLVRIINTFIPGLL